MHVRLGFTLQFLDADSGVELSAPTFPRDFKVTEDTLDAYFDTEVADAGVVGGDIHLSIQDGNPLLWVNYWLSNAPSDSLIEALRTYTVAQLEDGIGEGGFACNYEGKKILIVANCDAPVSIEVINDGRSILGPSQVAIAAREGDISRLAAEIESGRDDIDRYHQGCTPLHLAILYGHPDAVRVLLAAGADPNKPNSEGLTPLEACALSNMLDDEQSRDAGQMLMVRGASSAHTAPDGASARDYAEARGKRLLAAIL